MRLSYDDNDQAIAEAVRSMLTAVDPIAQIRVASPTDPLPDSACWVRYAEQGWFGLSLPESAGGVGYGMAEQAIAFREIGWALAPGPVVATAVAARAAVEVGAEGIAAALIDGRSRAAFAADDQATSSNDPELLVVDGVGADYLLSCGPALLTLSTLDGIELHPCNPLDPGSRVGSAVAASTDILFEIESAAARDLRSDAEILSAAILSGVAERAVVLNVDHVSARSQFGKPIGSFQAVAHRSASMATRAEAARCQVLFAALSREAGASDAPFHAAAALAVAADAALENGVDCMRNHGALGMTYECDAHFCVTRARTVVGTMGTSGARLRGLAESSPPLVGIE